MISRISKAKRSYNKIFRLNTQHFLTMGPGSLSLTPTLIIDPKILDRWCQTSGPFCFNPTSPPRIRRGIPPWLCGIFSIPVFVRSGYRRPCTPVQWSFCTRGTQGSNNPRGISSRRSLSWECGSGPAAWQASPGLLAEWGPGCGLSCPLRGWV